MLISLLLAAPMDCLEYLLRIWTLLWWPLAWMTCDEVKWAGAVKEKQRVRFKSYLGDKIGCSWKKQERSQGWLQMCDLADGGAHFWDEWQKGKGRLGDKWTMICSFWVWDWGASEMLGESNCIHYLLLHNKPPPTLVAQNSNHLICSRPWSCGSAISAVLWPRRSSVNFT